MESLKNPFNPCLFRTYGQHNTEPEKLSHFEMRFSREVHAQPVLGKSPSRYALHRLRLWAKLAK